MNEELTTFIVKELGKHQARNHLIEQVCKKGGLSWKQSEQLVVLIEARRRRTLPVQQTPTLLFLSIGILILGIGLLSLNLQILIAFFQADLTQQVLHVQGSIYRITGLLTGFGMTIGGLLGLWKSFDIIFPY